MQRELTGKVAWAERDVDPHACVLGLPGQVNKFDSNRPLLTVWDCLTLLPHRVEVKNDDDDDEYGWLDDER